MDAARLAAAMANRYEPDPNSGCWLWTGAADRKGYGRVCRMGAHRAAWCVAHGEIPAGLFVCHWCDTPPCVRPDHLFLGTPLDNMRDCIRKGRARYVIRPAVPGHSWGGDIRGTANPLAKLTDQAVREIRAARAAGEKLTTFSAIYGVTTSTIYAAANRRFWRHVQ